MPVISLGIGLEVGRRIDKLEPHSFEPTDVYKKPEFTDQVMNALGYDTAEKRQTLRAWYERGTGFLPRLTPPGDVLIPTVEEKRAQEEHAKEVSNFLAEEEVY